MGRVKRFFLACSAQIDWVLVTVSDQLFLFPFSMSVCLSVCLSTCLSTYLFICVFVCLVFFFSLFTVPFFSLFFLSLARLLAFPFALSLFL